MQIFFFLKKKKSLDSKKNLKGQNFWQVTLPGYWNISLRWPLLSFCGHSLWKTQQLSEAQSGPVCLQRCEVYACVCLSLWQSGYFALLKCTFITLHPARGVLACARCGGQTSAWLLSGMILAIYYVGFCCAVVSWAQVPSRSQIKALNVCWLASFLQEGLPLFFMLQTKIVLRDCFMCLEYDERRVSWVQVPASTEKTIVLL